MDGASIDFVPVPTGPKPVWRHGSFTRSRYLRHVAGAWLGGSIGLLILLGFSLNWERAWRPFAGYPATHPTTAMCVALLAFGISSHRLSGPLWRRSAKTAVVMVLVLMLALLFLQVFGQSVAFVVIDALTPFKQVLAQQAAAGTRLGLGMNTILSLGAIAMAELFRQRHWPTASQIAAGSAIGLLFVVFNSYVNGLPRFYGALAPLTFLAAGVLATVELLATRRQGFMRALLAPSEPGRLARWLLGASTGLMLFIGWLMSSIARRLAEDSAANVEAQLYQTTAIVVLIWIIVIIGLVRADKIDRGRRRAQWQLIRSATTDALTGLLGRNRMLELHSTPAGGKASATQPPAAQLDVDLDDFRTVNEAFGLDEGDKVLVEVGRRLRQIAGSFPVGRIGGDEFAIYCPGITLEQAERLGKAVTAALAKPFQIQGRDFRLSASTGVAHTTTIGETDLRQAAGDAIFAAKEQGGGRAVTFFSAMHDSRKQQIALGQDLHAALLCDGEFSLVYQPVIHVADRRLIAVEALARWTHPRLGAIVPDRFVPIAEAMGLIVPLGRHLMLIAIRQAVLWQERYADRSPVINLNLSPVQLAVPGLIANFQQMLARHGLTSASFCIEVTESAFVGKAAVLALEEARRLGFKISMDDFGVGYSTLSQLPRLPLSSVKLDRSFIVNAMESVGDAALLAALVKLAHDLGLAVVAEGVETPEQFNLIAASGCDAVQGYLVSRPLAVDALEAWMGLPRDGL